VTLGCAGAGPAADTVARPAPAAPAAPGPVAEAAVAPQPPAETMARIGPGVTCSFSLHAQPDAAGVLTETRIGVQCAGGKTEALSFRTEAGLEMFRRVSYLADVDFDGYLDLVVLRDFGAKFAGYDVRRFDPATGRFVADALARRIGKLVNLTVDRERRRLLSYSMGPSAPYEESFRVERGRLVLEESCRVDEEQATVERTRDGKLVERRPYAYVATAPLPCQSRGLHATDEPPAIPWTP
jgi:hypothetical protein